MSEREMRAPLIRNEEKKMEGEVRRGMKMEDYGTAAGAVVFVGLAMYVTINLV